MKQRYLGNFFKSTFNYGNWISWAYNATIGFPLHFSVFYVKGIFHNLRELKRRKNITKDELKKQNIFKKSLVNAWGDMKRKWRNLAINTYAGGIVRRWMKEYEGSEYSAKLERLSEEKNSYYDSKKNQTNQMISQ